MAKKTITILSDKFKGTLSSEEVAETIAGSLSDYGIEADFFKPVMADGGQGTARALNGVADRTNTYYVFDDGGTQAVYVPSCGESLSWAASLHTGNFPCRNTFAVGRAVRQALTYMTDSPVYVGIGGTVSADLGFGFLKALGYVIKCDGDLSVRIEKPSPEITEMYRRRIIGLADVRCPLSGDGLSALSFIPQKGGTEEDISRFRILAGNLQTAAGSDEAGSHSGAGGGLGYAIETVAGCRTLDGAEFILQRCTDTIEPDMYITGEGLIDSQTAGGKVVDAVYRHARRSGKPVVAFCGKKAPGSTYPNVFPSVPYNQAIPSSKQEAIHNLAAAVRRAAPIIEKML